MRTSPLRAFARKGNSQGLNLKALKDKRDRDVAKASEQYRIDRRGENHKLGQKSDSDIHHKSDGTTVRTSTKNNRNVWKHGERT